MEDTAADYCLLDALLGQAMMSQNASPMDDLAAAAALQAFSSQGAEDTSDRIEPPSATKANASAEAPLALQLFQDDAVWRRWGEEGATDMWDRAVPPPFPLPPPPPDGKVPDANAAAYAQGYGGGVADFLELDGDLGKAIQTKINNLIVENSSGAAGAEAEESGVPCGDAPCVLNLVSSLDFDDAAGAAACRTAAVAVVPSFDELQLAWQTALVGGFGLPGVEDAPLCEETHVEVSNEPGDILDWPEADEEPSSEDAAAFEAMMARRPLPPPLAADEERQRWCLDSLEACLRKLSMNNLDAEVGEVCRELRSAGWSFHEERALLPLCARHTDKFRLIPPWPYSPVTAAEHKRPARLLHRSAADEPWPEWASMDLKAAWPGFEAYLKQMQPIFGGTVREAAAQLQKQGPPEIQRVGQELLRRMTAFALGPWCGRGQPMLAYCGHTIQAITDGKRPSWRNQRPRSFLQRLRDEYERKVQTAVHQQATMIYSAGFPDVCWTAMAAVYQANQALLHSATTPWQTAPPAACAAAMAAGSTAPTPAKPIVHLQSAVQAERLTPPGSSAPGGAASHAREDARKPYQYQREKKAPPCGDSVPLPLKPGLVSKAAGHPVQFSRAPPMEAAVSQQPCSNEELDFAGLPPEVVRRRQVTLVSDT
eukprot:TRINITY_DN36670_c0_g1_i1.p1 TRINITY_DN36670_c0_g1~~TRINITY_DN36670_c0_g1_i1.p1  ORF type:complete len:653 (-),score=158.49 TRINITY_DN36670_c0_g1_i1:117-2075(-)